MTPITEVDGRRLSLSNLEKVLYPDTGWTKGELLHYYATVAEALLPHLANRPVSFLRFPDGPDGQLFFTKNVPPGTPAWVKTAEVPHSDGPARQVLVQDLPSLMWAANLVTEFHTPQWLADTPAEADRLVIDLDPGEPANIVDCCQVALWLRKRLAADGLEAFAKTSGSKGLHLLVPLERTESAQVTAYARSLAVEAARWRPDLVTHLMKRSLRPRKVFVDFSQNAAAKTTATPYTLRARAQPAVSAPVTWKEVEDCGDPADLVLMAADLPSRLRKRGDLLAPLLDATRARPLP